MLVRKANQLPAGTNAPNQTDWTRAASESFAASTKKDFVRSLRLTTDDADWSEADDREDRLEEEREEHDEKSTACQREGYLDFFENMMEIR